ncbi:MAG: Cna B-type domain-containing protein, partial [Oscillospiraceae bacterium]
MNNSHFTAKKYIFIITLALMFFIPEICINRTVANTTNKVSGSITWAENWGWTSSSPADNAIRYCQIDEPTLSLKLELVNDNDETDIVYVNTQSQSIGGNCFLSYSSVEKNSTWNYTISNIPENYSIKSVIPNEVAGYTSAVANMFDITYTLDTEPVTITAKRLNSSLGSIGLTINLTSSQTNKTITQKVSFGNGSTYTFNVPKGYEYSFSVNNSFSGVYVLKQLNNEDHEEIIAASNENAISNITSKGEGYQDKYVLYTVPEGNNTFKKVWSTTEATHAENKDLKFQLLFLIDGEPYASTNHTTINEKTYSILDNDDIAIQSELFGYSVDRSSSVSDSNITFTLPEYTLDGKEVTWAFQEEMIEGYIPEYTLNSSTYEVQKINNVFYEGKFIVNIKWNDIADNSKREKQIVTLALYRTATNSEGVIQGGSKLVETIDLQPENVDINTQSYIFDNLISNDSSTGAAYNYYVIETLYTLDDNGEKIPSSDYKVLEDGKLTVSGGTINNVLDGKVSYSAEKIWSNNKLPKPYKTYFYLYRYENKGTDDIEAIKNAYQVPNADDDVNFLYQLADNTSPQTISWDNLDKYSNNGYEYVYFVKEVMIGFQTDANGIIVEYESQYNNNQLTDDRKNIHTVLFNGSVLTNIPLYKTRIDVSDIWIAAALQETFADCTIEAGLLYYDKAEKCFKEVTDPKATDILSYKASAIESAYLCADKYDSDGNEIQYIAYQKSVNDSSGISYTFDLNGLNSKLHEANPETDEEIQDFILNNLDYSFISNGHTFKCTVTKDGDNAFLIKNTIADIIYFNINKQWNLQNSDDVCELTFRIKQTNSKDNSTSQMELSVSPVFSEIKDDEDNVIGEKFAGLESGEVTNGIENADYKDLAWTYKSQTNWIENGIILPKYDENGYEYDYSLTESEGNYGTIINYTKSEGQDGATYLTANVNNYNGGGGKVFTLSAEKKWIVGGDVENYSDVIVAVVKNTLDESGNKLYFTGDFNSDGEMQFSADRTKAKTYVLNESNNWKITVQYPGDAQPVHMEELALKYSYVNEANKSVTETGYIDYTEDNYYINGTGSGDIGGSVCTSNQEYRVISEIKGTASYFTNRRVGNVTLNIDIVWKDKGCEKYRPTEAQGVELKITGSDEKVYNLNVNFDAAAAIGTSKTLVDNGVTWTLTKTGDNIWKASAALIKYDEKTGVAISYVVEEVGRDVANERITFDDENYYVSYESDEYIISKLRNDDIQNVTFTNVIDKTTELVIYKVWCDDAVRNMRPELQFTIYTKDNDKYAEYNETTICTREKVSEYENKPYDVWKITYSNLPVYNLETCELIEYYAKENKLDSSFYNEIYYYHNDDNSAGIAKAISDLDDTSYNSDNDYQLEFSNHDDNPYLTNNDCVINKISDTLEYSFAKKWTGFDGVDGNMSGLKFNFTITCTIENSDISYICSNSEQTFSTPSNNENVYKWTFPKYDAYGRRCIYTISEQVLKDNTDLTDNIFDISINNQSDNYSVITNNYGSAKNRGSVTVSKIWDNIKNGDTYPEMTFELYRIDGDTEKLIDTVKISGGTFNEGTDLTKSFDDVLIYSPNGDKYKYKVKEKTVYPAYTCTKIMVNGTEISAGDIQLECGSTISFTNTYNDEKSDKMTFTGTKVWNDYNYSGRPENITLTVKRSAGSSTVTIPCTITWNKDDSSNWTYTITTNDGVDLPVYATTGGKWSYYIVENSVNGYSSNNTVYPSKITVDDANKTVTNEMNTLTNTLTNSFSMTKQWIGDDKNKYITRPASVMVLLQYQVTDGNGDVSWERVSNILQGYEDIAAVVRTDYYQWYYTFKNLAWDKTYRVVELGVCDESKGTFNSDGTYTLNDNNVTYEVYEYKGQKYRIVKADDIDKNFGYTVKYISEDTISNILAYTDLVVTKTWVDDNNIYGFRPENITLRLQRKLAENAQDDWQDVKDINGNIMEYIMKGDMYKDTWSLTIPNIPKYSIDDKLYKYRLIEVKFDNLDITQQSNVNINDSASYKIAEPETDDNYNVSLKNTIILKDEAYRSFTVSKRWIGSTPDNAAADFELIYKIGKDGSWQQYTDEDLKSNVHVTLDGTADDNTGKLAYEISPWTAVWEKLPKYAITGESMEEIYYSAIETDDDGNPVDNDIYTVEAEYEIDDTGNITNQTIYNIENTPLQITKIWEDNNNKYKLRSTDGVRFKIYRKLAAGENKANISAAITKNGTQTIPADDDWEEVKLTDTINNSAITPYIKGDINVDYSNPKDKSGSSNEVILYADTNTYSGKVLNLPKYDKDNNEYIYIAVEQQGNTGAYKWQYDGNDTFSYWNDADYQNAVSKFNSVDNQWEVSVANRLITGNIKVNELFKDNGNRIYDTAGTIKSNENVDAYRPDSVNVSISATYSCPASNGYTNGNLPSTSSTLIFSGNYTNSINDLPVYDAKGTPIKYTVTSATNKELSQYKINAVGDVSKIIIEQDGSEVQQGNTRTGSDGASNNAKVQSVTLSEDYLTEITFPNVHETDTKTVSVVKKWTDYNTYKEYLPTVYGYLIASFDISASEKTYWLVPSADIDSENPMKDWKYLGSDETSAKTNAQGYFSDMLYKKELANDGTSIKWVNLPVNAVNYQFDGVNYELGAKNPITYQAFEIESPANLNQYSANTSVNGDVTTITNTLATVDIPVLKYWDDDNNRDGIRPDEITINLTGSVNNTECYKDSKTMTSDSTESIPKSDITGVSDDTSKVSCWKYVFANVPKYDSNGNKISYSVTENSIANYTIPEGYPEAYNNGYLIVNKHEPELIDINVTKIWNDNSNADRPASITVNLLANGIISQTETLTVDNQTENTNEWKYTFTDYKYDNGTEIKYTISENPVTDYNTYYNQSTFTITNTQQVDITVNKIWVDSDNSDNMRPESVTVNLLADGVQSDTATISADADGNWTYTFENLDKYNSNGTEIVYTVSENPVDNYRTSYSEDTFTITNTLLTDDITINKVWVDNDNSDSMRPESITVNLLADGKPVDDATATISADADGNWTYTFKNLDKYNSDGTEIVYTVSENPVDNYRTSYSEDTFTIT